jgi:hypothetical protein
MKKNMLYALLLTLVLNIWAMDAPPGAHTQEIPADLQLRYSPERDRFRSYNLDNPENKFLSKLRKDLKKDEDVETYLENLHLFANLLLAQHLILNQAIQATHINDYQTTLLNNEQKIVKKLGAKEKESGQFLIFPPTTDALNEIVAHQSILLAESLTPEQLRIAFIWSFTDDVWFQSLAEYLLNRHILKLIVEERRSAVFKTSEKIITVNMVLEEKDIEHDSLPRIIKINTQPMYEINQEREKAEKRLTSAENRKIQYAKSYSSLTEDFSKAVILQGLLYKYTHKWYEQLYKVIRNEISTTIKDLITKKTNISGIGKYAANIYTDLLPEKVLPVELPPLSPAVKLLSPSDFEQDKLRIKNEWILEQKKKEEERKRNNKIKQTEDGSSYILEFEDIPTSITIHNQKNNTQEIIFKHESPFEIDKVGKKIFPIKYTDWVNQWFVDPKQAIATQGYNNPASLKFRAGEPEWKPIVLHAFSPLVDDYIKQWGRITTTKNRKNPAQEDILITIPGKIIYPPGSQPQEEAGIFAYIIDSQNGQWYHRMFTPGSLSELTRNLFEKGYFAPQMTGYYDVFFPPLAPRKK